MLFLFSPCIAKQTNYIINHFQMIEPIILLFHIMFIIMFLLVLASSTSSPPIQTDPKAPALYVFGDSLLDNGNNNLLPTLARADYFPYGINFPSKVTLGRFTDGRTPADFIAEYLGLPYPPPYASLSRPNLVTGYNYASGACGILPETGAHFGRCYTLDEQIGMFKSTIESELNLMFKDLNQLHLHLSKSIFFLSVGNNDYLNNYLHPFYLATKIYDPLQFAEFLVDALSRKLQALYQLGGRKFLISEVGPLGCIPSYANGSTKLNFIEHIQKCDNDVNSIVTLFNNRLSDTLTNLEATLQYFHFTLVNSYSFCYDVITNPTKYGLNESSKPCCRTWLNGSSSCIPEETPCSNPDKHYFWDGYHPTQVVISLLSTECIYGSSVCHPSNFSQLVQL